MVGIIRHKILLRSNELNLGLCFGPFQNVLIFFLLCGLSNAKFCHSQFLKGHQDAVVQYTHTVRQIEDNPMVLTLKLKFGHDKHKLRVFARFSAFILLLLQSCHNIFVLFH